MWQLLAAHLTSRETPIANTACSSMLITSREIRWCKLYVRVCFVYRDAWRFVVVEPTWVMSQVAMMPTCIFVSSTDSFNEARLFVILYKALVSFAVFWLGALQYSLAVFTNSKTLCISGMIVNSDLQHTPFDFSRLYQFWEQIVLSWNPPETAPTPSLAEHTVVAQFECESTCLYKATVDVLFPHSLSYLLFSISFLVAKSSGEDWDGESGSCATARAKRDGSSSSRSRSSSAHRPLDRNRAQHQSLSPTECSGQSCDSLLCTCTDRVPTGIVWTAHAVRVVGDYMCLLASLSCSFFFGPFLQEYM